MSTKQPELEPIAIIGMSCRFPGGANSPSKLWEILRHPYELAERIPAHRFDINGFYSGNGQYHGHTNVKEAYFLAGETVTRQFDAPFFGMSPAEAMCLDPQCRLSLETVYEALESAGLTIENLRGSDTAVYAGQMVYDYEQIVTRDSDASLGIYHASGTSHAVTSNRISYFFDWHGPSMTIDTACSSSLVAFHHAVQQLRSGLSNIAVATGVNLLLDPGCFISLSSLNMLSPDGRSRMWSANANGYARGEGIAAVVLKPLSAALRDGDGIECIVRETGFAQDGRTSGLISPNAEAQVQLIRACYERAGLDLSNPANHPQFFECHGTGTQAGDVAEARAISNAFGLTANDFEGQPLKVGSVKTIIGHTEGAAGLAGIIKASLALQNTTFPPNLLFDQLNPRIKPFYSNLEVSTTAAAWKTSLGVPLRASVNSFGFAGANAHAILERYVSEVLQPSSLDSTAVSVFIPFVFSASTESSLLKYLSNFKEYLLGNTQNVNLRDLAYTLYARRSCLQRTTSITASGSSDLCVKIDAKLQAAKGNDSGRSHTSVLKRFAREKPNILGVFTGQGAQWAGMASSLIKRSLAVRRRFQQLEARLSRLPEAHRPVWSLTEELESGSWRTSEAGLSQPLCTAVQILQIDILRATGIEFSAVVGHSSGEIAAAYAADLLSADDCICIAYYRGLATKDGSALKPGAMMAVGTSASDAQELLDDPWLDGRSCIAAINSPVSVTLSGDEDAIDQIKVIFDDEHKFARKLKVDVAYHSHHMYHCSAPYRRCLSDLDIQLGPGNNTTWFSSAFNGRNISGSEQLLKSEYWDINMIRPVMFKQAIEKAYAANGQFDMIIELGPHPALQGPTLQTLQEFANQSQIPYTSLFRRDLSSVESVADGLGYLWSRLSSKVVNLKGYEEFASSDTTFNLRKGLPSYAWDHQNEYWNESRYSRAFRQRKPTNELLGHMTPDSTDQDVRWRQILKPAEMPWLTGHLLQDQIVFPAAGYLATALEAAMDMCQRRKVSPNLIELLDIEFGRALVFNDENSDVEIIASLTDVVLKAPKLLEATFKYHAADARGTNPLELFASGRVHISLGDESVDILPSRNPSPPNLVKIREQDYYAASRDLGYQWAGPFVALDKCWRKLGFATGVLNILEPSELLIPPPVLDAAFQGTLLAYSYPHDGQNWTIHVPGRVKRMSVNPSLCRTGVMKMDPLPFDATHNPDMTGLYANVDIYSCADVANAVIQVEGLTCIPLTTASAHDDKEAFATVTWGVASPVADLVIEGDPSAPKDNALPRHLERMAAFHLRELRNTLSSEELSEVPKEITHLLGSAARITSTTQWFDDWKNDTYEAIQRDGIPFAHTVDVEMVDTMGAALGSIARGESLASEMVLDNDLLGRFHNDAVGPKLYNKYLARILRQIVHKNSHMDIFEVGAGTGAATRAIMDSIGSSFASYTFTDISTGYFESAKSWSGEYTHKMMFKRFDASRDPVSQGFTASSYDVVVAALVLHATPDIEQTLQNLRRLIKPGGYLIVFELLPSNSAVYSLIFGSSPSWWIGEGRGFGPAIDLSKWDSLLRRTGFSGCDTATPTHGEDCCSHFSVFVSQAVDEHITFLREPLASSPPGLDETRNLIPRLVILGGKSLQTLTLVQQTWTLVSPYCTSVTTAHSISDISWSELPADTTILSILDIDNPILSQMNDKEWNALKEMLNAAGDLLWVTQGRLAAVPHSNMIVGFLRSIVREVPTLNYRVLDFEDDRQMDTVAIAEVLIRFQAEKLWIHQDKVLSITAETELVLNKEGRFMIPRLITDEPMNNRFNSAKRQIIGRFDRLTQNIAMVRPNEKPHYELRQETSPIVQGGPNISVIDVTYSTTSAVRTSKFGCLFVMMGLCRATGKQVVALSSKHTSSVRPSESLLVRLDRYVGREPEFLSVVAYELMALAVLEDLGSGDFVLVHESDVGFATALDREATASGIRTMMVTSTTKESHVGSPHAQMIHPSTPDRIIADMIPTNISSMVDFSFSTTIPSVGSRVRSLLPSDCSQHSIDTLLSSTPWEPTAPHHLGRIQERFGKAVKYALSECTESTIAPPVIPVKVYADVDETIAPFSIFDWTGKERLSAIIQPIDTQISFADQKTYWFAGLSGGLGLALCDWMTRRGARYFVISSRNPNIDKSWLNSMRLKGVTIKVAACDITIKRHVESLHDDLCASMPPIAGVIQGANSWEDTSIAEMDLGTFLRGTRPKVEGSINLDGLFQTDVLDFFVFFSSVVAVVGRPGQTYYSAANMFMTALAEQRRRKGLAASVIHIGPIYGVGHVAQQEELMLNKEKLRFSALTPVSEREFYQLFSEAVTAERASSHFGPIELLNGVRRVDQHDSDQPVWATEPMMDHLIKNPDGFESLSSGVETKAPLKTQLAEARDLVQVYNIMMQALIPKICSIFQIDSKNIDNRAIAMMRLDQMGLDSLSAVEIRGWFMKMLEINVPVLKILSGISVGELVTFAVEKIPEKLAPSLSSSQDTDTGEPDPSMRNSQGQDRKFRPESADDAEDSVALVSEQSTTITSATSSPTFPSFSDTHSSDANTPEFEVDKSAPMTHKIIRLSFSQELLWFVWSFLEDKTSLNHTAWARITGEINKSQIQRAFRLLSQRHEALRTRFITQNGRPLQAIMESSMLDVELGTIKEESEVHRAVKMLKDEHTFDVERGLTGRIMLLSRSRKEHFMVAGLHPLVADGFSFQSLLKGMRKLYIDPQSSQVSTRRHFTEHSEQQHINLASGQFDNDIQFWKHEFASIPPPLPILSLSSATQRPAMSAYENEEAVIIIDFATKQRVQTVCRRYGVTPFHFYLAVFRALLLRFSPTGGADDVVVGIGDANRTEDELVDVIGPIVNLLPVLLRTSATVQFCQLLQHTRDRTYGALEHSKVPLQVLLNRLNITRSALHTPLFQCFANYRQGLRAITPWAAEERMGPVMSSVEIGIPKVAYDVSLEIVDYADGECRQTLVTRKDMYGADETRRLARSLELLIEAFVADPTLCLDKPDLFDSRDVLEVMKLSRGPSWTSQWPETIVHQIENFGHQKPQRIALCHANKSSTYEEVLAKANTISNSLISAQISAGSPVAVLQEPSSDWISSVLGIMRVGAAYLPLDQGHPWARLAAMAQDCEPHVILVDEDNLQNVHQLKRPGMQIINVSNLEQQDNHVPIAADKNSLAAILYTSGSSGSPKGILLHHEALKNWAEPLEQSYGVGAETVLQQTTWTFDISLAQILTALCFGGRLVLVPRHCRGDAKMISELIASQHVTLVFSTPSEYKTWFNYGGDALTRAVAWNKAFSGGEPLSSSIVECFRSLRKAGITLYSLYGPGECATNATAMQVDLDAVCTSIAVGRPVPNYSVYVVDSKLRPVAVGVQGEICIGGAGVGRGYVRKPRLTMERFIPSVLASAEDIARGWNTLHRTGDLGRWRPDGTLLIEGRISGDTQVKIRGNRIDLCEVENAIIEAADGAVLEALVSKRDSSTTRPEMLIAHVVCKKAIGTRDDCIRAIQTRLSSTLPSYMCPTMITTLERMPLTSSGKLDRRAAAVLLISESDGTWDDVCENHKLTETELCLKGIWQDVLQGQVARSHGSIGPDRDFFHIGGSSLHLLDLQAKIKEAFGGLMIPLVEMFDSSTLSAMARCIDREGVTAKGQLTEVIDWDMETAVPASLLAPSPLENLKPTSSRGKVVVLTGATGQLGGAILKAMIQDEGIAHVHCIGVRDADNRQEGLPFNLNGKVTIHAGDLYWPRLGLSEETANIIFAEATSIIHSAADKSYQKSFTSLRAPNLQTTKDLAIMAATAPRSRPPPDFHYISTAAIGMLVAGLKGRQEAEGFVFRPASASACPPTAVSSSHVRRTAYGYMASKWASEVFLERLQVQQPGWRIVIHRPGLIERPAAASQWAKEDESTNGPVNDMLENLQYFAPRLKAVPALSTAEVSINGVLDVISLGEVIDGVMDSILNKKQGLLNGDGRSGVEFIHHVSDTALPLDDLQSWLGEAVDKNEGRGAWRQLPAVEWARLAGTIGMNPTVVALFESVAEKEGIVQFYKAARQ